jgi:uncharacterized protein
MDAFRKNDDNQELEFTSGGSPMKIRLLIFPLTALLVLSASGSQIPDTMFRSAKVPAQVPLATVPFSLTQVRLLDGPFKQAMERDLKYMLSLDNDRLLHSFRLTAGLPSNAKPYGGWEKPDGELRGHTMGHYLSACAFMYASTGDARVKARADGLIAELAQCQQALGPRGYLSAFPEEFFDRVEATRAVWAPYYTLHKILAGLLDWYECGGNVEALSIAEKIASWVKLRTDKSDPRHMERVLNNTEQGGMCEALANLYSLTGKAEYLKLARRFDEQHYIVPLSQYKDVLKGEHVNSFIPNIIGAAREYEMTGDIGLSNIAQYFWSQVTGARTYATGGTSNDEVWRQDPYVMASELGAPSHETCCTYNMLKLTRHLFNWEAKASLADYFERALFNGILSTQNPADGMMMYYVPMMPGMYKTFMTPEDSFWCCTGSGMENHAKYGDSIYFHGPDALYVNLYIASELRWPEKGLTVRQDTKFPEEQGTRLTITAAKPVDLALNLRIPGWIAAGGWVKVNGKKLEACSGPSSFLTLRRTWKTGDTVELSLPMDLHLERLPDDSRIAAILYGPIVLAGRLGTEGLAGAKTSGAYGPEGPEGAPVAVPKFRVQNGDLNAWIKPVAGKPLTFQTSGAGLPRDVTLIPFYKLFGERYSVYWTILLPGQEEAKPDPRRRND